MRRLRVGRTGGLAEGARGWRRWREALEEELRRRLAEYPGIVGEAMRYAALDGGKRVRGLLFLNLLAGQGCPVEPYLPFAAGLECIHAYSLVHDDLPAMDDDLLRRGRPTCHRVFGEAQAILAGDALLTEGLRFLLATEVVSAAGPPVAVVAFQEVAEAVGARGMVYGQSLDMLAVAAVEEIHRQKTAAFFRGLAGAAAHFGGGDVAAFRRLGEAFGLAFQIMDDLLDRRSSTGELGKTAGKDDVQRKRTYTAVHGEAAAEEALAAYLAQAEAEAERLPKPDDVLDLLAWARERRA